MADVLKDRVVQVRQTFDFRRRPIYLLPPLFDVPLLWMSKDQLAVAGFERRGYHARLTDFAQTWLCEVMGQGVSVGAQCRR